VREPHWHDKTTTLYVGNPREVLTEMPDGSVDCIVTSPPPWTPPHADTPEQATESAGREPTPALYIAVLRRVFAETHRVLADEGTVWIATGDLYANLGQLGAQPAGRHARAMSGSLDQAMTGLPAASLIGLPWQLAFALRDDGWIIRNAIVWDFPSVGIDPARGRFTQSYELIFLLAKHDRHYFDPDAPLRPLDRLVTDLGLGGNRDTGGNPHSQGRRHRERQIGRRGSGGNAVGAAGKCRDRSNAATSGHRHGAGAHVIRAAGDVWSLPARQRQDELPLAVPLRCIATGCRPGGTVLDTFAGTATTGLAARALTRSYIGVAETEAQCRTAEHILSRDTRHTDGDA
jgi:hypothetical protein